MRYISYVLPHDQEQTIKVGVLTDNEEIYDVTSIYSDMIALVRAEDSNETVSAYIKDNKHDYLLNEVELTSPITNPVRNIFCVGWNYLEHFEERHNQEIDLPDYPTFFTKATHTIAGPYENIPLINSFTEKLDYEAELALVIGKKGINITKEQALDHVFGYMCANDISARDVQFAHGGQWFKGKSMDKSCPTGPYLVSKDEIADPHNLSITCTVNDTVVQSSNTNLLNFSIQDIIAELSRGMTLLPGDIILTGTPSGIGSKRNPPLFLKENDEVVVQISEIGEIKNKIS